MIVGCWKCGSAVDPDKVPGHSKALDMDGKFCPTCHAPLTKDAAARFNAANGTHGQDVKDDLVKSASSFETYVGAPVVEATPAE